MTSERRTVMVPLTDEWYTAATQPRYHPDGTVTFVLTPPRKPATNPWFVAFVAIILFSAACVPWLIYWRK